MTSPFDPNAYMNLQAEGSFETSYTPVPDGEYPASVDDVKLEIITFGETKEQRLVARLIWSVLDDAVKAALSMQKVVVRQDIFIDLTPDGRFDTGKNKNVDLGRVREALGQNTIAGWTVSHLRGAGPAWIKVTTRPDKKDETKVYNDVKGVRKFAA